jgi:hypothetical protein
MKEHLCVRKCVLMLTSFIVISWKVGMENVKMLRNFVGKNNFLREIIRQVGKCFTHKYTHKLMHAPLIFTYGILLQYLPRLWFLNFQKQKFFFRF